MTEITWELGVRDDQRVIGLGTVVETARLRSAIAGHLPTVPPAREITAYAVGTHDEHFVPIARPDCFPGLHLSDSEWRQILESSCREVASAAQRVKKADPNHGVGTLHPIVEAAVRVTESIATNRREILTVSV